MSSFRDAYLTDAGAELLAKMIAEGTKIEFVKMVIGNGVYEEEERSKDAIKKRTELKNQKQEFGFESITTSGEGRVTLKALIHNKNVTEGYRMTEIGIIAKIKGDTTTEGELYSVAVAEEADYLPSESTPITYIQEYNTQISNAENVVISIEESAYALAEDVLQIRFPVYEENEELAELESGEEVETKWGKVAKAIKTVIDHIATRASITVLGHVKLSDSTEVTEKEGLALPATEKNPNMEGTLANQIDSINTDVISHLANKSNPHGVTATQIGADKEGSAQASYENSVAYTDKVVADLINGAPSTLDTLKEIADAMEENETVVDALNSAIGTKANAAEVDSHFATKATMSALGHVMLSDSAEVTEKEGLALPTTEKNPNMEGTLAHDIASLNTDLGKIAIGSKILQTVSNQNYVDVVFANSSIYSGLICVFAGVIDYGNITCIQCISANTWRLYFDFTPTSAFSFRINYMYKRTS